MAGKRLRSARGSRAYYLFLGLSIGGLWCLNWGWRWWHKAVPTPPPIPLLHPVTLSRVADTTFEQRLREARETGITPLNRCRRGLLVDLGLARQLTPEPGDRSLLARWADHTFQAEAAYIPGTDSIYLRPRALDSEQHELTHAALAQRQPAPAAEALTETQVRYALWQEGVAGMAAGQPGGAYAAAVDWDGLLWEYAYIHAPQWLRASGYTATSLADAGPASLEPWLASSVPEAPAVGGSCNDRVGPLVLELLRRRLGGASAELKLTDYAWDLLSRDSLATLPHLAIGVRTDMQAARWQAAIAQNPLLAARTTFYGPTTPQGVVVTARPLPPK